MGEVQKRFSGFINIALKCLFIMIVFISLKRLTEYFQVFNYYNLAFLIFFSASGISVYWALKKQVSIAKVLIGILIYSLIIRIAWISSINSVPFSDYGVIFNGAQSVLKGEFYIFKGSHYFGRFPHLTMIVLYFSVIIKFFTYPLVAFKIVSAICSTGSVFLLYFIVKEVFDSRVKGIWASFIAAVYPPIIIYTAVYCGENIAITFYLLSIYLFILAIKGKKPLRFLTLSAFSLSIGNMFRMVAAVMITAYVMYILIYFRRSIGEKLISVLCTAGAFLIPFIIVSTLLKTAGITEFDLWKGSEPSWTSILKGTNIESWGRYNEADSCIADMYNNDYKKTEEAAKEIVRERLTKTPLTELIWFYCRKYTYQWREGDFGGVYWAESGIEKKDMKADLERTASVYIQLIYSVLILLTYIGLFNKKLHLRNTSVNLFYIIYCGYALLFLITESQDRYSFIASWLFIILPFTVFDGKKLFEES